MYELITNNKETELVRKKGVGNNYQVITDNEEIELKYKPYWATFGKEIGGKEKRGKTTWEKLQHLTRAKNELQKATPKEYPQNNENYSFTQ